MMLLFTCVAVFRKRFQSSKPNYDSSSTLREGTWFNLVPNDSSDMTHKPYEFENRSDMHLIQNPSFSQPMTHNRQSINQSPSTYAVRYAPCSIPSTVPTYTSYPKHEFGTNIHEYSEIGSITADSGRGDSLNGIIQEQHYAQVTY